MHFNSLKVLHEHARASACCMLPNVGVLGVVHLVCVRVVDAGARLLRLVKAQLLLAHDSRVLH